MSNGTQNIRRTRGTKKSFNFEADVESLFNKWKERNPMMVETRVINAALREWFVAERAAGRKGKAA